MNLNGRRWDLDSERWQGHIDGRVRYLCRASTSQTHRPVKRINAPPQTTSRFQQAHFDRIWRLRILMQSKVDAHAHADTDEIPCVEH
ncbi:unnamed protein product [Fusarium graminearum]|nr:unnamed protein product [Fusarium graminearum]